MALASAALKSARTYLNDVNGITWTDSVLMPYLQEAHSELVVELERNSIAVIKNQTSLITVPANTKTLPSQPANLIEPISMMEGAVGDDIENFIDMTRVTFLPPDDPDMFLNVWAWLGETIQFLGATSARQVFLRYEGSLPTPVLQTDPLGFIFAERYIGPRIAALAKMAIGIDASGLIALAATNLHNVLQYNVTNDQIPTRHRAYRSPFKDTSGRGPSGTLGSY